MEGRQLGLLRSNAIHIWGFLRDGGLLIANGWR